jgi:hypothetical protein
MGSSEIQTVLSSFKPIALGEMEGVSLMNRVETKYVFSTQKLTFLLDSLAENYKVLDIGTIRAFPYRTIYLDTPEFLFYTQQVRGKLNRHKIRYRWYESTGVSFLEIKKRTNKHRTIKWRIENKLCSDSPDRNASAFIREYLNYSLTDLKPVLINEFTRITLVGLELKERITIDYNLSFTSPEGNNFRLPFIAIAELKREMHNGQTPVYKIMRKTGIQPCSFSKYCIGSTFVRDMPRMNILKPDLLLINKIENEYTRSART